MKQVTPCILLTLLLFLSACIGAGVIHNKTESYEQFGFTTYSSEDLKVIIESEIEENPSKQDFIERWGEPAKIKQTGDTTIWTYKTGVRWAGAVPMIGIGIPVAVPTGKNSIELHFRHGEDRPYLAQESYTTWSGGYYGPENESSMKSGFHKLEDY